MDIIFTSCLDLWYLQNSISQQESVCPRRIAHRRPDTSYDPCGSFISRLWVLYSGDHLRDGAKMLTTTTRTLTFKTRTNTATLKTKTNTKTLKISSGDRLETRYFLKTSRLCNMHKGLLVWNKLSSLKLVLPTPSDTSKTTNRPFKTVSQTHQSADCL
jgi:hypothetical protein